MYNLPPGSCGGVAPEHMRGETQRPCLGKQGLQEGDCSSCNLVLLRVCASKADRLEWLGCCVLAGRPYLRRALSTQPGMSSEPVKVLVALSGGVLIAQSGRSVSRQPKHGCKHAV